MACNDYEKFQMLDNVGDTLLMSELENNIKSFFDWALLKIGSWTDVDIPTSGAYGGDFSNLKAVTDASYTNGQVWQGARKDWVWETGVNYIVPDETGSISGVSYNGTYHVFTSNVATQIAQSGDVFQVTGITGDADFQVNYTVVSGVNTQIYHTTSSAPTGSSITGDGTWQLLKNPQEVQVNVDGVANTAYHVNYPLGRIIFDTAQSTTATITSSYSFKNIQVYTADAAPWWTSIQHRSLRPDDVHYTQTSLGGEWSIGGHHRIQLPAIILEGVPQGTSQGYELGNGALNVSQDMLFHVLAENRHDRNQLLDICRLQNDKTIWLYKTDNVAAADAFPLDYRGMRTGSNMYPDLVSSTGYRWKMCTFTNAAVSNMETPHPQLYAGVVRITMEVVVGTI